MLFNITLVPTQLSVLRFEPLDISIFKQSTKTSSLSSLLTSQTFINMENILIGTFLLCHTLMEHVETNI